MAVTETPPETVDAASETADSATRSEPTGLAWLLGTGDHKAIGRLYILASLVLGGLVVGLGEAFAVEAVQPKTLQVFGAEVVFQLFTLTRVGTVFFLALPLVIGVAMVVVPLQVGAKTIAFPRAAAASFWGWLLGSGLLIASYAMNGGPRGGSSEGVNLWISSMGLLVASVLLAALCLATTVLALRPAGLTLARTPLFAWSVAVAAIMWLLTLPVLLGLLVIMYVDHRHAGAISKGSPAVLYTNLTWLLRNPQIYVVAIPVLGFFADVLATTSGARMKGRPLALGAIAAFGTFSFGAFLVVQSETVLESPLVVALALLAVVPVLAVVVATLDAFRRGSFSFNAGVAYAVCSLLILLLAVSAGALGSIPNLLDAPDGGSISDNIFFMGVSHAAVLAAVIASLGGIHWWATKVGRQPASEKLGMLAPVVLLVGAALTVIPDLASGLSGEGLELGADYTGGVKALNGVVVAGVALVAIGTLLAVLSFLPLLRRPDGEVPADPWTGQTLEWLTASPPSLENFDSPLATVTSAEPLIDLREEK